MRVLSIFLQRFPDASCLVKSFFFSFSRLSYFAGGCCFELNVVSVRSFCLAVAGLVLVRDLIGY